MNILDCTYKLLENEKVNFLEIPLKELQGQINEYNFSYEATLMLIGMVLNQPAILKTKKDLNISTNDKASNIIVQSAIFAYIFIGKEYNDAKKVKTIKTNLVPEHQKLFISTLLNLIQNCTRMFDLEAILGDDNSRANIFAVNALSNLKQGIGIDNFHITLFAIYQCLELKLKHCLKKYVILEKSAAKKHFNFHNLIKLIKMISTSRVEDEDFAKILKDLREYLRYFEKINPGGQAVRYEANPNTSYFNEQEYTIINEKDIMDNFIHALNLLQKLYLKILDIYESTNNPEQEAKFNLIDQNLANIANLDLNQKPHQITGKLENIVDDQIFGDYDELVNLTYEELNTLKFLVRIGIVKQIDSSIKDFLG